MRTQTKTKLIGLVALASLALAACSNADPLGNGGAASKGADAAAQSGSSGDAIVIGSQDYYSNEIIAEVYAQVLENAGLTVDRQFRIGQREAYMDEIESGKIDLFPEYTGPLLRYWKQDSTATEADAVYTELKAATPEGLKVLDMAPAADQDSYVVTKAFADKYNLNSLSDLSKVTEPITMGANSEAESRNYGPKGLKEKFNLDVKFTPIEDGGGPLTVKALKDNTVQMAIIYSASPELGKPESLTDEAALVPLKDDKGLFTSSNVVALASHNLPEEAIAKINKVNKSLTTDYLISMNVESVKDQKLAKDIAKGWLETHGDLLVD